MTEVLLPSLNIPGPRSLQPNNSLRSNQIDRYTFPFAPSCAQAFRDRLPPVAERNKSAAKLRLQPGYSPNYWSYGTSYLVTLLFNGKLPNSFLKEMCHGHASKEKSPNIKQQQQQQYSPLYKRDKELWEPKNPKKLQESARRIDLNVLQAQRLKRKRLDAMASKLRFTKDRGEDVLLTKEGTMERGKRAYLDKLGVKGHGLSRIKPAYPFPRENSVADSPAIEDDFVIVEKKDCVESGEELPDDPKSSE